MVKNGCKKRKRETELVRGCNERDLEGRPERFLLHSPFSERRKQGQVRAGSTKIAYYVCTENENLGMKDASKLESTHTFSTTAAVDKSAEGRARAREGLTDLFACLSPYLLPPHCLLISVIH